MNRTLCTLTAGLLLTAAPVFAQTTPAPTSPTVPVPAATQPAPLPESSAPTLGLPAQTPSAPAQQEAPVTAPEVPEPELTLPVTPSTPEGPASEAATPAEAAATVGGTGAIQLPVLEGETVLRTVPTVLGEALIYPGSVENALPRTVTALEAEGYTVAEGGSSGRVKLEHLGQTLTLTLTQQLGLTVLALSGDPQIILRASPVTPADSEPVGAPPSAPLPSPSDPVSAPSLPTSIPAPVPEAPGVPVPTPPEPVTPDGGVPSPGVPVPTPPSTP